MMTAEQMDIFCLLLLAACIVVGLCFAYLERKSERDAYRFRSTGYGGRCSCGASVCRGQKIRAVRPDTIKQERGKK
jgi:hypothetical protein